MLVLVTSYLFWVNHRAKYFIPFFCCILLISVTYVAYLVYTGFLSSVSLDTVEYAYASKNSIASIIGGTIVIAIFNYIPQNKICKILYISIIVVLVIVEFMLKSRASIAGLLFVVVYVAIVYKNKHIRYGVFIGAVIVVLFVLINDKAYQIVVENILLNGHETNDISGLSSGRDSMITDAWSHFVDNPILGYGSYYVDCFPVGIIVQYGIVGAFIFSIFLYGLCKPIFKLDKLNKIHCTTFLLLMQLLINALFEAQPPFGPGIKCSLLWMMVGFSCAELYISKKQRL